MLVIILFILYICVCRVFTGVWRFLWAVVARLAEAVVVPESALIGSDTEEEGGGGGAFELVGSGFFGRLMG